MKYTISCLLGLGCSTCPNTLWRNWVVSRKTWHNALFSIKTNITAPEYSIFPVNYTGLIRGVCLSSALFQRLSTMLCFSWVLCTWGVRGQKEHIPVKEVHASIGKEGTWSVRGNFTKSTGVPNPWSTTFFSLLTITTSELSGSWQMQTVVLV